MAVVVDIFVAVAVIAAIVVVAAVAAIAVAVAYINVFMSICMLSQDFRSNKIHATTATITTTMIHINWDTYNLGAVNDNKMKGKHSLICFLICSQRQQNEKNTKGHKIGRQDTCARISGLNFSCLMDSNIHV